MEVAIGGCKVGHGWAWGGISSELSTHYCIAWILCSVYGSARGNDCRRRRPHLKNVERPDLDFFLSLV